jgi:hypothetical protein
VHARARCHGPNLFGLYKVDSILSSDGIGRVFAAARAPPALLVVGGTVDPPTLLSPTSAQAIALMCQQGVVGGASSLSVLCPRSPCACTCTCTRTCTRTRTVSLPVPLYTHTHLLSPRNRNSNRNRNPSPITNLHPALPSSTAIQRTSTASSRCHPADPRSATRARHKQDTSAEKHPLTVKKTCDGTDRGNFRSPTQPARQLPLAKT